MAGIIRTLRVPDVPETEEPALSHVHVHTSGRDCDGLLEHWHREQTYLDPAEYVAQEVAGEVRWRVLAAIASPYEGTPDVHLTTDDDGGCVAAVTARTDEGWTRKAWETCDDPHCERDLTAHQRDHTAESMGY